MAPVNLRLERAKEKKRKPEVKNAPTTSKKQKITAVGLAIPNNTNSMRFVLHFHAVLANASPQKYMYETMEREATGGPRSRR